MNNQDGKVYRTIEDIFHSSNNELFNNYKLTFLSSSGGVATEESDIDGDSIMSVLGASGEGIKLLASIKMSTTTATFISPSTSETTSLEDLQDLCGELNNQLMGKIKNKMLAYECKVLLGLPTIIKGKNIASASAHNALVSEHLYRSDAGDVIVCLHTVLHPELEILNEPNEELSGSVSEGMLSFF